MRPPAGIPPRPRANPEADLQRAVVKALRLALPQGAIVHHSPNEERAGGVAGRQRQAIAQGMGVWPGFADLIVLCPDVVGRGRVVFLELKSMKGRQSDTQKDFEAAVRSQGHGYAVVRSIEEALAVLRAHGLPLRAHVTGGTGR